MCFGRAQNRETIKTCLRPTACIGPKTEFLGCRPGVQGYTTFPRKPERWPKSLRFEFFAASKSRSSSERSRNLGNSVCNGPAQARPSSWGRFASPPPQLAAQAAGWPYAHRQHPGWLCRNRLARALPLLYPWSPDYANFGSQPHCLVALKRRTPFITNASMNAPGISEWRADVRAGLGPPVPWGLRGFLLRCSPLFCHVPVHAPLHFVL